MARKILVVEDDEAIRDSLIELLRSEGYEVESAANGQIALETLANMGLLPNLILLDLMMPVMDGFAFCREKSKQANLAQIPTIVMSADNDVRRKKNETGAAAYIKKPVDINELVDQIAEYFPG